MKGQKVRNRQKGRREGRNMTGGTEWRLKRDRRQRGRR